MLASDNDPEIYFLAKLIIEQISGFTESLGRVRGISGGLILNIQPSSNRQLTQEIDTLRNHLNTAHKATAKVLTADSEEERRIAHLMPQLFKTSDHFITRSGQLMHGEKLNIDAQSFSQRGVTPSNNQCCSMTIPKACSRVGCRNVAHRLRRDSDYHPGDGILCRKFLP